MIFKTDKSVLDQVGALAQEVASISAEVSSQTFTTDSSVLYKKKYGMAPNVLREHRERSELEDRLEQSIIIPESRHEGEAHFIFYQDSRWRNGSMPFANVLRDKDDMVISALLAALPRGCDIVSEMFS